FYALHFVPLFASRVISTKGANNEGAADSGQTIRLTIPEGKPQESLNSARDRDTLSHMRPYPSRPIPRRTFLRGVGVAMALPWLESIPVWGDQPAAGAAVFPKRFAAVFMGNGINSTHWWAKGAGAGMG